MTKRGQVETALARHGFTEEAQGDWIKADVSVYLDIAHSPETAWVVVIGQNRSRRREVLSYDELLARFK
jgi:hypothetical protein